MLHKLSSRLIWLDDWLDVSKVFFLCLSRNFVLCMPRKELRNMKQYKQRARQSLSGLSCTFCRYLSLSHMYDRNSLPAKSKSPTTSQRTDSSSSTSPLQNTTQTPPKYTPPSGPRANSFLAQFPNSNTWVGKTAQQRTRVSNGRNRCRRRERRRIGGRH